MSDIKNKTIAEIVSDDIGTASVFKKYNLDFCCGGGTTVEKACEKANINTEAVIYDLLNNSSQNSVPNLNFKAFVFLSFGENLWISLSFCF